MPATATAVTAAAATTMASRAGGARGREPQRPQRAQGVRPLAIWHFPGRPARSALVSAMDNEQTRLGLTQAVYAFEELGMSRRTYLRFRSGEPLSKQFRQSLLLRRPKWKRLIEKVALEDVRFTDLLGGLR